MIENIEKLCKEAFNVHNVEQLFYFAEKYDFRPLKSDNYKKELLIDVMEEEYFYKSPIVTLKFDKIENYLYSTCCLDNIIDKIVKKYNNTTIDMISKEDIVVDYNFKGSNSKELCTFNFYE